MLSFNAKKTMSYDERVYIYIFGMLLPAWHLILQVNLTTSAWQWQPFALRFGFGVVALDTPVAGPGLCPPLWHTYLGDAN